MSKIDNIIDDILNIDISQLNDENKNSAVTAANEAVIALEELQKLVEPTDE